MATAEVLPLRPGITVSEAAEAFLTRDMPATTRRSYTQTIGRLAAVHGATLVEFTAAAWGGCAPATWNRHVATLRSFTAHARRRGWTRHDPPAGLERRREPADRTEAIAASSLERMFRRRDVAVRDRLSYERAEYLFKQASLGHTRAGWTLHQLRHSALTHLAEAGVNLPLLMAKSGHQNLRSLQRYARPDTEAVAAMTAAHDPARRRR